MKLLEIFKSWYAKYTNPNRDILACFEAARKILWDGRGQCGSDHEKYVCICILKTNYSNSTKNKCIKIVGDYLGVCNNSRSHTAYTWYIDNCGYINPVSPEMQNVRFDIIADIINIHSK